MATTLCLLHKDADGLVPIYVRVQCSDPKTNVRMTTGIEVPADKWRLDRNKPAWDNFKKSEKWGPKIAMLDQIRDALDSQLTQKVKLDAKKVRAIIDEVKFMEQRAAEKAAKEEKKRADEEARRMTLNKFVDKYLDELSSGARQTDKGTNYDQHTIRSIRGSVNQFKYFQRDKRKRLDFDDIDMDFYYAFTAYMKDKNYSINTIGKHIANLKSMMRVALDDGLTTNQKWASKKFKSNRVDVDTIYLTEDELKKIMAVDLSKKGASFEQARDLFMVGVRLAQRVSDYNYLTRDMIQTFTKRTLMSVPDPENPGQMIDKIVEKDIYVAKIIQDKTNKRVAVPCHPDVVKILEKYSFQMPSIAEQTINDNIKEIARMAGITQPVEIIETKGGVEKRVMKDKCDLITTHTARRTGATLMYLSGMDCFDIMKMTGHDSPSNLKKYIKANDLDVIEKITSQYDYFG